ncbi:hypothetical protein PC129_g14618 [Phytophthora cactorum]|uniref:Uncharacterized protein n=1 Tax=Phytophthora cactorum TaxID=29920 RepID=A0A8T1HQG8_9STRA|nr:hypothetical protein Pcac1_g17658 [Phytophthora cactorum]KAG2809932.1 hypothetical protein PC112_g16278 [Phytophthora cactorum]KAG2811467.1 hypothetical protein PC111_g15230 [Phytophthora cactorum]KAG2850911.1 hypothetical protein PC113_g16366 [Phytophthora cactorum]KAG2889529.1 hypothetical protein PC114_g17921 [Phytophthora cactorum]
MLVLFQVDCTCVRRCNLSLPRLRLTPPDDDVKCKRVTKRQYAATNLLTEIARD